MAVAPLPSGTVFPADKTNANTPSGASWELAAADVNFLRDAAYTALNGLVRENILPNTQWQVATGLPTGTKMNFQGTGTLPALSVSSYTTGSNTITCLCSDTSQLKVGDLVQFSVAAHANVRASAMRVDALVTNVSFTGSLPLNLTAPSSAACTATPIDVGAAGSVGAGDAFDGWGKSANMQVWREDNAVNLKAGSRYSCGVKLSSSSPENMYHAVPLRSMPKYAGRNVAIGMWCNRKIGTGNWKLFVLCNGTGGGTFYSSIVSTSGYQWQEMFAAIPSDCTSLTVGIEFNGAANDVFYVSQPIAGRGTYIGQGNYFSPENETLIPVVKMTPSSYNGATVVFPSVANAAGDYGFAFRPGPETNGAIAPTVKKIQMQLEARTNGPLPVVGPGTAGVAIGLRNRVAPPHTYAMLRYATVTGAMAAMEGDLTLDPNGEAYVYSNTAGSAYTDTASNWYQASIDINGYVL